MSTTTTPAPPPAFELALSYAARGWRVVPLHAPDGNGGCSCRKPDCESIGKHPRIVAWQHNASSDDGQIRAWFLKWLREPINIGVALGPASGIVDVEFDGDEGREVAEVVFRDVVTPSFTSGRSVHRLLKFNDRLPPQAVVKQHGLEIRIGCGSRGAQSVFPPSTHHTGQVYSWLPGLSPDDVEVADIPDKLWSIIDDWQQKHREQPAPAHARPPAPVNHASDQELLAKAFDSRNGAKFRALWNGDVSAYPSHSEADLALADGLSFWAGPDPDRIAGLMWNSGLVRQKWEKRPDYLQETIQKALSTRTEFYTSRNGARNGKPIVTRKPVSPETIVQAGDRENWGTVKADNGSTCTVEFVSDDGNRATKELPKTELKLQDGTPLETSSESDVRIELIDSAKFAAAEYRQRYIVNRILVADQPAIVGGRSKTMKTSLLVDLALSLGTGTPFLGEFAATKTTVAILSGETGQFTLQETARRIATAKQIDLARAAVHWGFRLPQLARIEDLDALEEMVRETKIEVLIVDPAYLCLLAGDVQGLRSSDVFSMGPLLLRLSELGVRSGCTVILAHHCRKNSPQEQFSPPDLEELAMAGFAEWARQWLLLGRRETYEQGSGIHRLWLNIGGSAGHSGCFAIDIDEGQLADDFTGRKWEVAVSHATDARRDAQRQRDLKKAKQMEERENEYARRLLAAMRNYPAGETKTALATEAGLNTQNFGTAIRNLVGDGRAVACEIEKNGKPYEGYKPTGK